MAENANVNEDIEQALARFEEFAAAMNIELSEAEIEAKRRELEAAATGNEVALYAADGMPEVESWDQVARLDAGDVLVVDDYVKLDDKKLLVNVPFFINRWFNGEGDMGPFVVARCITSRPIITPAGETSKVIITDGSTGIFQQLRKVALRTERTGALIVRNGLRRSEYTTEDENGNMIQAETFYLT